MKHLDIRAVRLSAALAACPVLRKEAPGWEELWLALADAVCTTVRVWLSPRGSSTAYRITPEYRNEELLAAMAYLQRHEAAARAMTPDELVVYLRRVATTGPQGSARAAQRDALCGMTGVAKGASLRISSLEARLGGDDDGLPAPI